MFLQFARKSGKAGMLLFMEIGQHATRLLLTEGSHACNIISGNALQGFICIRPELPTACLLCNTGTCRCARD